MNPFDVPYLPIKFVPEILGHPVYTNKKSLSLNHPDIAETISRRDLKFGKTCFLLLSGDALRTGLAEIEYEEERRVELTARVLKPPLGFITLCEIRCSFEDKDKSFV
ncbi:hypothetical protein TNCV_4649781 [Trichonephila clavipes]|uniref:Uncharacterized protein n=1 Tax=Trichonephila clavipes TaxID=2585209 RepID=A0A8X6VRN9_TRICX|nr:hypothetical protein TNCV_4649781 [Trichonephila clavipes]